MSRSLDTRPRSYGMESVEDDPFIEAHFASLQSMNSTDGKKKKGDSGVNFGYLSQGIGHWKTKLVKMSLGSISKDVLERR